MAGSHNLLFLIGLLLGLVCLAHSQSRRVVKRFPSVYRTREAAQNEGGEEHDIGSLVDSMHKALLLLEHRIMNLETNEHNFFQRLEIIEAMLYSPSAEELAGEITEQPQVAGSNTSNGLPSGIKSNEPSSSSSASNEVDAQNGDSEENDIGTQNSDEDEGDSKQGNVVALLEDAGAAIAEAADILNNQHNPQEPETEDAGKDSESKVNVDEEEGSGIKSSEEVGVHSAESDDADTAPKNYVIIGSDDNEKVTVVAGSGSGGVEEERENAVGVGKTEEDGVDKRYRVDKQQRQTRPQNRSFRFHRRLLPYNRRVSIHSGY